MKLPRGPGVSVAADHMAEKVQATKDEVQELLEQTKAKYKAAANKHRHFKVFQVDDVVMVFLKAKISREDLQ